MDERPRGTVTFLFTDIEGSTRILRALGPERYKALLDRHLGAARAAMGPEAEAVWRAGQRLSLDEAVSLASGS